MRRVRLIALSLACYATVLLASAPEALAHIANDGHGWYGETTDSAITSTMFLVILFFPVVIVLFSLVQWQLDKRKHARMDAAKRRAANVDWRGGW
jgi:heme/copper-type cytochrome/quinol oxidase subunit 2